MALENISKDQLKLCLSESKRLENKGKLIEALSSLDKVTNFLTSKDFSLSLPLTKQIASLCNKIVLTIPTKVPYLKKAEQALVNWLSMANQSKVLINEKIFRLVLLTYNNWAIYHQSSKNYHMALSYLMKGLKTIDEQEIVNPDSLQFVAKTKLNVSALYSELHRFDDAIKYAEDTLHSLQTELRKRLENKNFKNLEGKEKRKVEDMITTYVISFYNIGVAEEKLNHKDNMIEAFKNAVNIGSPFLNESNEALVLAKKALKDSLGTTFENPFKINEDINEEKQILRPKPVKLFLSSQSSEKKIPSPRLSLPKNPLRPSTGRYYSEAQLKKIQEKIEYESKLHFISADQYFYKEISKLMNIGSDIKYLRPLTTSAAMTWWDKQNEEKRKISDLRLKKQHRASFKTDQGVRVLGC